MRRHVLVLVHRTGARTDAHGPGREDLDAIASLHRQVATAIRADQFDVVPTTTARGGLNACVALEPACVVTELELGDPDGLWLTAAIRSQNKRIASTPIVLLAGRPESGAEADVQVAALQQGVDVIVPKPFAVVELVAQIRALVGMATRVRARARDSMVPAAELPRGTRRPRGAMAGDLTRMGAPSVLTALELEGRTGELRLADPEDLLPLRLFLATGALIGAQLGTMRLSPLDAVLEAMHWRGRTFEFIPGRAVPAPPHAVPIGRLTLLAIQEEDRRAGAFEDPAPRVQDAELSRSEAGDAPDGPRRRHSGTRRKVLTPIGEIPPVAARTEPGRATSVHPPPIPREDPASPSIVASGHGRRLLESLGGAGERRADPRAEPDDDETTDVRETA